MRCSISPLENSLKLPPLNESNSLEQLESSLMYSLNEDKDSLESKPIIRHLSNAHNHFYPESEYAQPITPVINSTVQVERDGSIVTY